MKPADPHSSIATFKRNWFRKKQNRMPLIRKQSKLFAQKEVVHIAAYFGQKSMNQTWVCPNSCSFWTKRPRFPEILSKLSIILDKVLGFLRGFVQITTFFGQTLLKQTSFCPNSHLFWTNPLNLTGGRPRDSRQSRRESANFFRIGPLIIQRPCPD